MKKLHLLKTMLLLCALIVGSSSVWGQAPVNTVLWAEDFSAYSNKTVPSGSVSNSHDGTTVYGAGSVTYACKNGGTTTQVYFDTNGPHTDANNSNLLISKSNGTFTVSGIPTGSATELTLSYENKGKGTISVSTSTGGVTISGSTITTNGASTIALTFTNTHASQNVRIDDISLIVKTPGSADPVINATNVEYDADETDGEIAYTITNPVVGKSLSATTSTDWITLGDVTSTKVPFTMSENTGALRQGSITLKYDGATDKVITVTQKAPVVKYNVNISEMTNGSVAASAAKAEAGETVTLTITPSAGYKLATIAVTDTDEGNVALSGSGNTRTFTMPAKTVTVSATFEAVITHAISYSVNGVIIDTQNVEEDAAVDLSAPESGIPSGYVFRGWSASEILTPQATEAGISYVKLATSTADITYYAVLAAGKASSATATIELESTDGYYSSYEEQTFTDNKGNDWTGSVAVSTQDSKPCIQMKNTSGGSAIVSPKFPGIITAITMLARNGSSKENRSFYFNSAENTNNGDLGKLEVPANHKYASELSATLNSEFDQFYLWVTGNLGFNKISVTYNDIKYSNYCTTATVPATITTAEYATFVSPYATDFNTTGITVYTATDNTTYVKLNEVAGGQVPANTPVVLYKAGADGSAIDVPVIASADPVASNDLSVVGAGGLSDEDGVYVLAKKANGVGFYLWDKSKTLNEGKVCLRTGASSAREFLGFDEGETTSLREIRNEELGMKNAEYFNLNGQRVAQPTKGLYIVNGRKVVIK